MTKIEPIDYYAILTRAIRNKMFSDNIKSL